MSRTYRQDKIDPWGDGRRSSSRTDGNSRRRQYSTPRYKSGSRRKPHRIVATAVRREPPDLDRLLRAIAQAALEQTSKETNGNPMPNSKSSDDTPSGHRESTSE